MASLLSYVVQGEESKLKAFLKFMEDNQLGIELMTEEKSNGDKEIKLVLVPANVFTTGIRKVEED